MYGMNPAQMKQMMKQLGIKTTEIDATKVIIETPNGRIVLPSPQVVHMDMKGQQMFQVIAGEVKEEPKEKEIPEEDIKMVAEQAEVSEEEAKKALEENDGDIAEAIMSLKGE
ncbi:MAG: nascent polypeptide-associated complex protein [Candidatus Diapherotrites archaeon]|nr:nascent polypeptide-associated complex protein [Candidatus Diapherotrites archaeon]